jgi:hypothetical protein
VLRVTPRTFFRTSFAGLQQEAGKVYCTGTFPVGAVVKFLYAFVVGFVAVSMIYIVDRFEPNRLLARTLTAIVYLAGALVILAKLG